MKRITGVSPTSVMLRVVLYDSSSTTGGVLTGLAYDTANLAISIATDASAGADVLTKETITTIGTYEAPTSSAHCRFKVVDATDMSGVYEIHLHNDTIASKTGFILKISGAANLAPAFLEVQCANLAANMTQVAGSAVSTSTAQLGVNVVNVAGSATTATLDSIAGQINAVGSGVGAALNFEVTADNASAPLNGVTKKGTASGGTTFANTLADNNIYHTIVAELDGTYKIDWVYKFTCGGGRNATKLVIRAAMAAASDTVNVQVYNFATTSWRTLGSITGTTETLYDLPLYSGDTGTGSDAGVVYARFVFDEADTGTINIDQCYVTAQNLGQTVGYANGSIWVKTAGTVGTTPYVHGTADNPCPWASAKTLNSTLGLNRYVITPGTTVTLDAALAGAVMSGRSYSLALGGQNVSGSYFEGVEGLSGTGTCATAEAIFVDCHLNAVTIGEADFIRCHLMNTVTMSQNSVPYRFHDCTGITTAKITFTGNAQTAVISRASGVLTIAGMQTGDTLYIDGDCDLTLDATNTGGTVNIAGNVRLTNSGSGQDVYDTARWDEEQNVTSVVGSVGSVATGVTLADGVHGGSNASITLGTTDVETQLLSAGAIGVGDAEQLRYRLSLDGTQTAPSGGTSSENAVQIGPVLANENADGAYSLTDAAKFAHLYSNKLVDMVLMHSHLSSYGLDPATFAPTFSGTLAPGETITIYSKFMYRWDDTTETLGVLDETGWTKDAGWTVACDDDRLIALKFNSYATPAGTITFANGDGKDRYATFTPTALSSTLRYYYIMRDGAVVGEWSGAQETMPSGEAAAAQLARMAPSDVFEASALVNAPTPTIDVSASLTSYGTAKTSDIPTLSQIRTGITTDHGIGSYAYPSGIGATSTTINVIDSNSNPVADCEVWITSDSDGTTVVAGPLVTDDDGKVVFLLDSGSTYYCWRKKSGVNFTNPSTFVASGD